MLEFLRLSFGQMAAGTIVGRAVANTQLQRQLAIVLGMTAQTLFSVVAGSTLRRGLNVRIVARDAGQLSTARLIALAQGHQKVVLKEGRVIRLPAQRNLEQR